MRRVAHFDFLKDGKEPEHFMMRKPKGGDLAHQTEQVSQPIKYANAL